MADQDLLTIKQSEQLMLEALGVTRLGSHCPCPRCKDTTGLRAGLDKKGSGIYLCQCMKCNEVSGTVLDVYIQAHNKSLAEAIHLCKEKLGLKNGYAKPYTSSNGIRQPQITERFEKPAPAEPVEPQIDLDAAEKFVDAQHQYLMNSGETIKKYLIGKRGITEAVAQQYRLGFLENHRVKLWSTKKKEWYTGTIKAAWVFPVTDWKGKLKSVKVHHEIVDKGPDGKGLWGKCFSMPFGKKRGEDGYTCFWPHLYSQKAQIDGVNFVEDYDWWIKQLPDGHVKDQWFEKIEHQTVYVAADLNIHPDDFEPRHHNMARQRAFIELQKEIQHEVLGKKDDRPSTRTLSGWTIWAPGELKAFAYISAGITATALTTGEGYIPTESMLRCFRGRRVALNNDDDVPYQPPNSEKILCTGRQWAHTLADALSSTNCLEVRVFSWGRK